MNGDAGGRRDERQASPLTTAQGFVDAYDGTPAWNIGRPQAALAALGQVGTFGRQVLDVGCGTGEHALLAAQLGSAVVHDAGTGVACVQAGSADAEVPLLPAANSRGVMVGST